MQKGFSYSKDKICKFLQNFFSTLYYLPSLYFLRRCALRAGYRFAIAAVQYFIFTAIHAVTLFLNVVKKSSRVNLQEKFIKK